MGLVVGAVAGSEEATAVSPAVAAAQERLQQVREHYQANELEAMAAAAAAGVQLLVDEPEAGKLQGSLLYWWAVSHEMLGDYDAALARYQQALALHEAEGNRREMAATLNSLANLHGLRGAQTERFEALVRARGIFDELGEVRGRAAVANSLGNYYNEVEQFEAAQPYYEQSVALRRTMDQPGYLATGLQGLGGNLRGLGRIEESSAAFEEALAIFRELNDPGGLADILTNLGNLARTAAQYDQALAAYEEALGYDQSTGYKYGEAILKHNLALTYQAMDQPEKALSWADQAVIAAEELGNPERLEHAYLARSNARESKDDAAGALADLRRMVEVREQRQTAARDEALLRLQTRFETAEKEREIEQLERVAVEQELALAQEEAARLQAEQAQAVTASRGRTTLMLALAALLAAGVLAAMFRLSRRSERRLARQQTEVEQAVAGLRAAHAELKRLYDRKSAWLGFAVHDLRSPLFAIDAVCGEVEAGLLEHPADGVEEIRQAARRMREDLDAWLEAERKEQTEIAVHPVATDLARLATDVVALNRPGARTKNLTLELSAASTVMVQVDPWRWSEVIDNLVSNAIKYTPGGGRITVTVVEQAAEGVLRVQDSGPGLSEEDREQLFTAFAQLSARPTGGETSTGLGLHLVKRIVDAHQGDIRVENAPEGGAIFVVTVPRVG